MMPHVLRSESSGTTSATSSASSSESSSRHRGRTAPPIARRGAEDETTLDEAERSAFDELSARDAALIRAYMRQSLSSATAEDTARIARFEAAEEQASGRSSWPVLLLRTSTELVQLGVNPAGPKASMARLVADQNLPWYRVHRPPTEGLWHTLPTELTVHDLDRQRESLATGSPARSSIGLAETSSRSGSGGSMPRSSWPAGRSLPPWQARSFDRSSGSWAHRGGTRAGTAALGCPMP